MGGLLRDSRVGALLWIESCPGRWNQPPEIEYRHLTNVRHDVQPSGANSFGEQVDLYGARCPSKLPTSMRQATVPH
jgi:hypothetical protein